MVMVHALVLMALLKQSNQNSSLDGSCSPYNTCRIVDTRTWSVLVRWRVLGTCPLSRHLSSLAILPLFYIISNLSR